MAAYKLTPRRRGRIVDALRDGATREAAAAHAGIAPSTLRAWLACGRREHAGPFVDLVAAVESAELHAEAELTRAWRRAADTDWRAAAELLPRRFPDRWRRAPIDLDVEHRLGSPAEVDAQAARLVELLRSYKASTDAGLDADEAWDRARRAVDPGAVGEPADSAAPTRARVG